MTRTPHLTSDGAACCWIPLFPLRCETARQPELATLPVALVGPDDTRRVWQLSPLARRAGVKPGMTVSSPTRCTTTRSSPACSRRSAR